MLSSVWPNRAGGASRPYRSAPAVAPAVATPYGNLITIATTSLASRFPTSPDAERYCGTWSARSAAAEWRDNYESLFDPGLEVATSPRKPRGLSDGSRYFPTKA